MKSPLSLNLDRTANAGTILAACIQAAAIPEPNGGDCLSAQAIATEAFAIFDAVLDENMRRHERETADGRST